MGKREKGKLTMKRNWLFEYSYDQIEIYTGAIFSEGFIAKLLTEEENLGTYIRLSDGDSEENLRLIGSQGSYIFEGDLLLEKQVSTHFVLAKRAIKTQNTSISVSNEKMTFPNNEIFNAQEAIEILNYFHNNKAIPPDLNIERKRYLF
jgi:hypothetical protein